MLTLLLPETLDRDLPDTVQDANYMNDNPNNTNRERNSSMAGDDTTTMSGMDTIARDGKNNNGGGSDHGGGQNTLLRMQGGTLTRIHSPIIEETNYGKSPEWVEIDGLIVSKSHLTPSHLIASANGTLSRNKQVTNKTSLATMERQQQKMVFENLQKLQSNVKIGSITSLPYCSQTLVSSNYSSTLEGSNSTTTTMTTHDVNTSAKMVVKRKNSNNDNDSLEDRVHQKRSGVKHDRRGNSGVRKHSSHHNPDATNIHLKPQLPIASKTLPHPNNKNSRKKAKIPLSKPVSSSSSSFLYQTNSSRSNTSGSSSCCSRSSSDCRSCHADNPSRYNEGNRYPAPPPPRNYVAKQVPPPPPSNPPPPLRSYQPNQQLFRDTRKNSFELLQDIGGESQSERESENQYETIPSSSSILAAADSDLEETDTDVQTIGADSYEDSGNDFDHNNDKNGVRKMNHILHSNKNINDALQVSSYYDHRGHHRLKEGNTRKSSESPVEESGETQDTSVTSVYDIHHGGAGRGHNQYGNHHKQRAETHFDNKNNNRQLYKGGNINNNNNVKDNNNTINDRAKLQQQQEYIFRKRLLMTEANETIL